MLKKIFLSHSLAKKQLFDDLNPEMDTWIVSDLNSKFELQEQLLKKYGAINDLAVLRMSELWSELFKRNEPHKKLISKTWTSYLLKKWLDQNYPDVSFSAHSQIFSLIEWAGNALIHPNFRDSFNQWVEEHTHLKSAGFAWIGVCDEFLQFLIEQNYVPQFLLTGFLEPLPELHRFWERQLLIDVGADLKWSEVGLLNRLQQSLSIRVLIPDPVWRSDFEFLLKPYQLLTETENQFLSLPNPSFETPICVRMATQVSEMKLAITHLRKHVQEGGQLSDVGFYFADVEKYWSVLQALLKKEGFTCNKALVESVSAFPAYQKVHSVLKIATEDVDFSSLQNFLFQDIPLITKRFEKFFSEFKNIMDFSDLRKDVQVLAQLQKRNFKKDDLHRDEFLNLLSTEWLKISESDQGLSQLVREIIKEVPKEHKASLRDWTFLLELFGQKVEVKLEPSDTQGLRVGNFQSADPLFTKKQFFFGITESQLKKSAPSLFSAKEIYALGRDLGFYFDHPDQSRPEFFLQWYLESCEKSFLVCAEHSVKGDTLTPAALWLEKSKQQFEPAQFDFLTRWDCQQFQNRVPSQEGQLLPVAFNQLSASLFEKYQKCPFILKAEKLFHLQDLPIEDIEADPMTEGSFIHALLEHTIKRKALTLSSALEVAHDLMNQFLPKHLDPNIKESLLERCKDLLERFLTFETSLREAHPDYQILATEEKIIFKSVLAGEEFALKGKIDRLHCLEKDPQKVVILDYKSSDAGYVQMPLALEKSQWQMVLYYLGLQQSGKTPVGLQYYFYRTGQSKFVFKAKESFSKVRSGSQGAMDAQTAADFFSSAEAMIKESLQKIKSSYFEAKPLDVKNCSQCEWSKICRAPHLN